MSRKNPFKAKASGRRKLPEPPKFGDPSIRPPASMTRRDLHHPKWLVLAACMVVLIPQLPFGNYLMYPFMILTTWFHEMGHGLTALLMGMKFDSLVLLPDGSGYAALRYPNDSSVIAQALVSAGGPLGPAIAGAALILASQTPRMCRIALDVLAVVIVLSCIIWVRSVVGWVVLPAVAALIFFIATKGSEDWKRFAVQFFGVHAAISMFGQWRYLFSSGANLGGSHQVSDTGAIEQYLLLPHWLWAGAIIATGAAIVGAAVWRVVSRYRQ